MKNKPKAFSYIRFSKPEQLKGDSLRRQLEASQQYADKHGLVLDDSLQPDKGLSAYHGAHRTRGALGEFLKKIDAGKIPEGSVLIVESLDRLSREAVLDALSQFTAIISRGVKIVTLADGQTYSRESIDANVGQLIISLTIMSRAHEESQTKAMRSRASWDNKRNNLQKRKITAKGPNWLKLNKAKQQFEPIPERAKLLNRMYQMRLEGLGGWSIAKKLNGEGIKPWQSKLGWSRSTIHRMLRDKAVIGWYQPHKMDGGKRAPVGDPISDYYPAVIDTDTFYRVQGLLEACRGKGGRKQFNVNLFPHVAKCGYCGAPMQILDKGKGHKYLQCNRVMRGIAGCPGDHSGYGKTTALEYSSFEDAFLKLCGSLNVTEVMASNDECAKQINELDGQIKAIDGQLADLAKTKANADKLLEIADDEATIEHVAAKLKETLALEKELNEQRLKAADELIKAQSAAQDTSRQLAEIEQLIDHMGKVSHKERSEIRGRLKSHIQQLVDHIDCFCNGKQFKILSWFPEAKYIDTKKSKIIEDQTGSDKRTFGIFFHAGGFREVQWIDGQYQISTSLKNADEEQQFIEDLAAQEKV